MRYLTHNVKNSTPGPAPGDGVIPCTTVANPRGHDVKSEEARRANSRAK